MKTQHLKRSIDSHPLSISLESTRVLSKDLNEIVGVVLGAAETPQALHVRAAYEHDSEGSYRIRATVLGEHGVDGKTYYFTIVRKENTYQMQSANACFEMQTRGAQQSAGGASESGLSVSHLVAAPMPGRVVSVNVEVGSPVEHGQTLVVLEAMKMENEIQARMAGVVESIHVNPGQGVELGVLLVTLKPA